MKLSTGYRHFEEYLVYTVLGARIPDDLAQVLWKRLPMATSPHGMYTNGKVFARERYQLWYLKYKLVYNHPSKGIQQSMYLPLGPLLTGLTSNTNALGPSLKASSVDPRIGLTTSEP